MIAKKVPDGQYLGEDLPVQEPKGLLVLEAACVSIDLQAAMTISPSPIPAVVMKLQQRAFGYG